MGLEEHKETITKVADVAGKEYSIEQVSNKDGDTTQHFLWTCN